MRPAAIGGIVVVVAAAEEVAVVARRSKTSAKTAAAATARVSTGARTRLIAAVPTPVPSAASMAA